ncbi:MAG: alkaline phosphatase [Phycisphaerae bacterium]|nr:alkaline phosphatase [Phycisphaerae bacterium]
MKVFKLSTLVLIVLLLGAGCCPSMETFYYRMAAPPAGDGDISFYRGPASDTMLVNLPDAEVRTVIYCIGDGMGFNHVALTRHYTGSSKTLWMELLPVKGEVMTHPANPGITDSAASGTAMACGVKTNNGMIGMTPDKTVYSSILEVLDKKGWRTGLVVTSPISHATPAVFASHIDSRGKQKDIAIQQFENRVDVLLGGGQKFWTDETLAEAADTGYQVIDTRDEMLALKPGPVIGLFADEGMTTFDPEPSLSEMTKTAIDLLSSKTQEWFAPAPKFFLMIEGSQIDWAAHANDADRVVRQTLLFDMAVREAIEFARRDGHTLVLVTADHETGGLTFNVDPDTGNVKTKWSTGGHTAANVPIFAFGPGAEKFAGTMDNTDIPKRIAELTGIKTFPVVKADVTQKATVK